MSRAIGAIVVVVVAAVCLVVAWPQVFGLERAPIIAQAVSLRGLASVIALVLVVVLTLVALLAPAARRFMASLAVVLLAFVAINVAVLSIRGFGNSGFESATDDDVTVLAWNTLGDLPSAEVIAELIVDTGAEVVVLPETTWQHANDIKSALLGLGAQFESHTVAYDEVSKARSTTLLVSAVLGEYTTDESVTTTSVLPTIVATPVDGTGPTIIAVHSVAPLPDQHENWVADLEWLAGACNSENVIMAGDFNSTLDHYTGLGSSPDAVLGDCVDAASATDNAAVGTWPTAIPALLGAPIDRVLATENWRVTGMRVIQSHDQYGSDHRPVLAQLTPAG
jgi:endonuclease/exonuclease/phosphatase (EEP) superfamily protein YafD